MISELFSQKLSALTVRVLPHLCIVALLLSVSPSVAQPSVDGTCSDGAYTELATFTSGNNGFGDASDVGGVYYYTNGTDLYVCIPGSVDPSTDHNILLVLNFSGYSGFSAGTPLPSGNNATIYGGDSGSSGIAGTTLDVEADYAFAGNIFSGTFYIDGARYGSRQVAADGFLGSTATDGSSSMVDPTGVTGGSGSMEVAYQEGYSDGNGQGLEYRFPVSIFSGVDASQDASFFVGILSQTGYWSNELLPDLGLDGSADASQNFGTAPDFQAASGDMELFTGAQTLPVELANFEVNSDGRDAVLRWETASETNNGRFVIEQANATGTFRKVGVRQGAGTTTDAQQYRYRVSGLTPGTYRFRLRQVDLNGRQHVTSTHAVRIGTEKAFVITSRVANPMTEETGMMRFVVQERQPVHVSLVNLLGQQVQVLYNGTARAGRSVSVQLDAAGLKSGMYFIHAKGRTFTHSEKVVIVE